MPQNCCLGTKGEIKSRKLRETLKSDNIQYQELLVIAQFPNKHKKNYSAQRGFLRRQQKRGRFCQILWPSKNT